MKLNTALKAHEKAHYADALLEMEAAQALERRGTHIYGSLKCV